MRISTSIVALLALAACGGSSSNQASSTPNPTQPPAEAPAVMSFESASVRPLALAPTADKLYVTNTPNGSVDIFAVDTNGSLSFERSITVGLEPVAIALNGDHAWVVNHLSDSISIVDIAASTPHVVQTLLVGDEPRDILFANGKAFITTAHRGQHRNHPSPAGVPGAGNPQLHTPGIPRADIWVFDGTAPGTELGGKPLKVIELFGDTPRALALSNDGNTVYAAVLNSGNQTTAVHESVMCYGFDDDQYGRNPCQVKDGISSPAGLANGMLPGGRAGPGVNKDWEIQPWTSMIVKYDNASGEWRDSKSRNFSNGIRFSLPDRDVFAIDSITLNPLNDFAHVGTTLFNMAVHPVSGNIYVSNTEANNHIRFEGSGEWGGSTVQGNIAPAQITVIDPITESVKPRRLNRHIDYSQLKADLNTKQHTVATPTEMRISQDGQWLYVAALGSDQIAVYRTADLDNDALWDGQAPEFDPTQASAMHIPVAGGPSGLTLFEPASGAHKLFVLTRFDNAVVTLDASSGNELQRLVMNNPEAIAVQAGRPMLYDAKRSSSNGEASCASCHIFADTDHLAWNLGNPDASNSANPQPFPTKKFSTLGCDFVGPNEPSCQQSQIINGNGKLDEFASMKGPMGTQTLRGMSTHGHMHWRGDRSNGYFGVDSEQTLDERTSFKNFIVAFEGLLGLDIELPANSEASNKSVAVQALEADMERFTDFVLAVQMPPNPIRPLDGQHSPSAQIGADFFDGNRRSDGLAQDSNHNGPEPDGVTCAGCHGLDPAKGFYGSRGEVAHGGEIQILKVPQLRNLYQRVGMFGLPDRDGFLPSHTKQHQGEQIRGFGFLHDGATDQLINFLRGGVFDNGEQDCPPGADESHGCTFNFGRVGIPSEQVRQGLVDYLMEFDSDLAPIVGQQITLIAAMPSTEQRLNLLEQRAETPFVAKILGDNVTECDLVAAGHVDSEQRHYLYNPQTQRYIPDSRNDAHIPKAAMHTLAKTDGNAITFTCTAPGSGYRYGLDRDGDGQYNRD